MIITRMRSVLEVLFSTIYLGLIQTDGGGVGVVVKDHIKVEQSPNGPQYVFLVELLFRLDGIPVRLVVVYRPPSLSCLLFLNECANYLEHLATSSDHLLLTGDFNLHVNSPDDRPSQRFLSLIQSYNLTQNVTSATHVNGNTLDLIITRQGEDLAADFVLSDPGISDHLAGRCKLRLAKQQPTKEVISCRNLRSVDYDAFCRDLQSSDLLISLISIWIYPIWSQAIIIQFLRYFNKLFKNSYAPLNQRFVSVRPRTPWYENGVLLSLIVTINNILNSAAWLMR